MPKDLTEVIEAAVDAAEAGEEAPEVEEQAEVAEEPASADDPAEDPVEPTTDPTEEPTAPTAEKPVVPAEEKDDDPEVTKILEEHGIRKAPKGQRDNPIPYSRTRKIMHNFVKKVQETHATDLKTRDTQIQTTQQEVENYRKVDRLIDTDPDRYISLLATIHPDKYGKYVKGAEAAKPAAAAVDPNANDPEPQADQRFADGTVGYSPEQFQKLNAWNRRVAAREAREELKKEYDQRFGPIEKEFNQKRDYAQRLPPIQAEVERLRGIYGEGFTEDEKKAGQNGDPGQSEILQYIQKNPRASLAEAAAAVFTPRIRADRGKIREEVLAELKTRPAAAAAAPAASKAPVATGPRDLTDVINEAIAQAGLK